MKNKGDNKHPSEWFSADKPIERRQEDLLGRRGFSEALADAIRRWSGQESLVLALYGEWGNGKSSIKNMVLDCLHSESPEVLTVDFNPWQLANRPKLSEAFFDELGVALGKGDLGSNHLKRSVLARYRRWAHRLQGGRDLVHAIRNLFGAILVALGVATLGAAWIHSRVITIILGTLLLLAGILALVSKFVDAAIKLLESGTDVGTKSISEVKAEIAGDLRKLKAPILVVLDDLDRLTPQEILEVFQLIKANGDFPNLIYLILCERTIVESNITKALNVPGRDFLEKIVQVAFDVPMIDVGRVRQVLFKRLDSLLSAEAVSARFLTKRWANVFMSGLRPYFATLRDVNRFISTLAFQFSSFSADGAFEVNPIDLIVLEVIRLYEPEVYRALQSNKELLTASSRPEKPLAEVAAKAVASIIEMGSEDRRDELRELMKHLFPTIEWALGGTQYAHEFGERWYRDLRVCSSKVFDRYFRLTVSEEELSQGNVQRLLRARGNREALRLELETLYSRGFLNAALEELAVYQDELKSDQVEAFITAIFDVADLLSDEKRGMSEVPVHWRVGFLVQNAIEKLSGPGARSEALISAIAKTNGLFMAVDFVALVGAPRENSAEAPIFSEGELVEARRGAVAKIESAAASGALAQHPQLAVLLGLWRAWGKNEDVASYIEALTKTAVGTLQLLRSLVVRSLRQGIGDYIGTERYYMRRKDVETLISMDTLKARVQVLPTDSLSDEDQRAIKAFQKAIERRSAGKPDDDPFAMD
jgi:predicted KAP-like P-loop ATPase